MSGFAGAALAMPENRGRLCCWGSWAVTQKTCGWLLISGDCNPPASVEVSKRKSRSDTSTRSGSYLSGINHDVQHMEQTIAKEEQFELVQRRSQLKIDVADCKAELTRLAKVCAQKGWKPCIYYTGHGECGTGDWCFGDGKLSLSELIKHFGGERPMVISDCCFSGVWANDCNGMRLDGFYVLSACCEFECAMDHTNKGGSLTLWTTGAVTNQKCSQDHDLFYFVRSKPGSNVCDVCGRSGIRAPENIFRCDECDYDVCKDCANKCGPKIKGKFPATCPLWSGDSYSDYKLPKGYSDINFTQFLDSQLKGKWAGDVVSAMSVTVRGKLTVLMRKVTPCPAQRWGNQTGVANMKAFVKEGWDSDFRIKFLEGFGGTSTRFYVHMEKGYGSGQGWFSRSDSDGLKSMIKSKWDEGQRLTACFADSDNIYCVHTKDVPEYHNKKQGWFLKNTWDEVQKELREKYETGQILNGLTYLGSTKQYFGFTTESPHGQSYTWKQGAELAQFERELPGFKRTLVFTDPVDGKTLTCLTSGNEGSRSYQDWSIDSAK